jgi:hypothetical protein
MKNTRYGDTGVSQQTTAGNCDCCLSLRPQNDCYQLYETDCGGPTQFVERSGGSVVRACRYHRKHRLGVSS